MEIKDKKTEEIVHKVIVKTEEQLEIFKLLDTERALRGNLKEFSISVSNQIVDEKTLDILIKILTLCKYDVPKMPKVNDESFRDMLSDVRIYDVFAGLNSTEVKKLFNATCFLDMISMKILVCTKMACMANVIPSENMVNGQWTKMCSFDKFREQAKKLGVKEEFNFANFQELKKNNDDARIICD